MQKINTGYGQRYRKNISPSNANNKSEGDDSKMELIKLILTSSLSVVALFLITKIMGHKQVAQLDFFDYVCGITIGSIGAELATNLEEPYKPLIALIIYGIASVVLNLITQKIPKMRKYINGSPTIIMNDGIIYRKNLKKSKLDLSEFMLLCREMGYFDLEDIKTAVLEHNGKLSVLPKSKNRPLTPSDLKIEVKGAHIATEIIMDGRILGENLKRIGKDEKWLKNELSRENFKNASDILLALYREEEKKLFFYPTN